jgi:hypothetical protein
MAVTSSRPTRALEATARRASGPAVAAGAAAAGLAGGLALGARASSRRRKVLGLPIGRKRQGLAGTVQLLAGGARQLGSAASRATETADDIHQIREQLAASNRRSPIEIVLDGLTHRRGAHRLEQ